MQRKKIGLALGAGGSKGLAHIGVIKVLEQNNIPIDFIAGSSIGALIGGFYAAKKNISEIEQLALTNNWPQLVSIFFDFSLKSGFVSGGKLTNFIQKYLGDITFSKTQIPFSAVAVDLSNGKIDILNQGSLAHAIRASISVPILLKPQPIDNKLLVDGGMIMPVPVEAVRKMGADIVIAVNLFQDYVGISIHDKYGLSTITNKTIDILCHYLALENVKNADIIINPKVGNTGLLDKFMTTKASQDVIKIGEDATMKELAHIFQIVGVIKKPTLWTSLESVWKNIKSSLKV